MRHRLLADLKVKEGQKIFLKNLAKTIDKYKKCDNIIIVSTLS